MMEAALEEAEAALRAGEVPVGAVLANTDGEIVARAHNQRESRQDPTAHAEMLVLQAAAHALGRWRLFGTTLYVTLEPCAMCAGALTLARVDRLVFAVADDRVGAVVSAFRVADDPRLNHRVHVSGGVEAEASRALLRQFFQAHRG
jgi:tRNA(adenine34) deaminase